MVRLISEADGCSRNHTFSVWKGYGSFFVVEILILSVLASMRINLGTTIEIIQK